MAATPDRLEQLLGVVALAASDRQEAAAADELGHGGAAPAALVHLKAHSGDTLEALRVALRVSQPAVVRIVDRLAAEGLVERRPGRDGRSRALYVTRRGHRAVDRILARRGAVLTEVLAPLSAGEREGLTSLLEHVCSALADDRPHALAVCRLCDRDACCGEDGLACPLQHTVPA